MEKFDEKLYLKEMYCDYYPEESVDKVKAILVAIVDFLSTGERDIEKVQAHLDTSMLKINELVDEFYDKGSEFDTVARESVCETVGFILSHFSIDIDIETATRERDF